MGYNPDCKWDKWGQCPLITGVISHLLSGMNHQVVHLPRFYHYSIVHSIVKFLVQFFANMFHTYHCGSKKNVWYKSSFWIFWDGTHQFINPSEFFFYSPKKIHCASRVTGCCLAHLVATVAGTQPEGSTWGCDPKSSGVLYFYGFLQGGAPPVICWFINPINYRYNPHKP